MTGLLEPVPVRHLPSSRSFVLIVEGEPVPQLGPRVIRFGRGENARAGLKANPRTADYQDIVRQRALYEWNGRPLIDVAIQATATFYRTMPSSFSKSKIQAALMGDLLPTTKPDCSNLMKAFEDALRGVVMIDDAQITDMIVRKRYDARARVELELRW